MRRVRRSASVVPRKRRRSNLKTMRTGATRVWRSLLWTSFRAMERGGRPSLGSSIRRFEFLFFLKAVGVSPFCSSHFKQFNCQARGERATTKPPSRSHRLCARNAHTDVHVHSGKNLSSSRKFLRTHHLGKQGRTSHSHDAHPPSACTRYR